MKTVVEVLKLSIDYLQTRKIERARRLSEELLSHVLKLKRIDLYLQYDRPIIEMELIQLRETLQRVGKGEPLEYIVGEVSFYGCTLKVDRRVLIPRPETEILVDLIAKTAPQGTLWDVCTGSGCIGISLKKKFPELSVTLSDISSEALSLAKENAELNHVDVTLMEGDLLEPFRGKEADLIVCNPPYVTLSEYQQLDPSVRDYEPKVALVGKEGGVFLYEKLALSLALHLKSQGRLFLEIGHTQGEALHKIFNIGPWKNKEVIRDWSGKERFFSLEKQ